MTDRPDDLAQTILHALDDAHGKFFGDGLGQERVAAAWRAVSELLRLLEQRTQQRDEAHTEWAAMQVTAQRMRERAERAAERMRELEAALTELWSRFGHRQPCDCSTCLDVRKALAKDGDDV